jgi:hypothetical protein
MKNATAQPGPNVGDVDDKVVPVDAELVENDVDVGSEVLDDGSDAVVAVDDGPGNEPVQLLTFTSSTMSGLSLNSWSGLRLASVL